MERIERRVFQRDRRVTVVCRPCAVGGLSVTPSPSSYRHAVVPAIIHGSTTPVAIALFSSSPL